jgi:hypothetical protein
MHDLPPVPQKYIDEAFELVDSQQPPTTPDQHNANLNPINERLFTRNGKSYLARANPRYDMSGSMGEWVTENISEEWSQVGVANSVELTGSPFYTGEGVNFQGPHADFTRSYVLFYAIDLSNTDQDTVFWREPGKSLYRKRTTIIHEPDHLEKIDHVRCPLHTWVYLNTSILHSIENVKSRRVVFHISFDCDPLGVFVPQYE